MHPADIQAALKKQGFTQSALAKALGVHPMSVSRVIHGKEVSDRVMRAVAKVVGEPVQYVFPEYYLAPPKRDTSKAFGPVQKTKVAQLADLVNG